LLPPDGAPGKAAPFAIVRGKRLIDRALMAYARAFEHPCKIRLIRWLIRNFARRIEIEHADGTVFVTDPDDYIGWQIFRTGSYEPASLALARCIVAAEPGLFVDVGAHHGWFSLAVGAIGGASVISIEPDSDNCSALRANIARNGLSNITVCSIAVGPEATLLAMSRPVPGNSGTSAVHPGNAEDHGGHYWVAATSLQALLERLVRPPVRPVLLKIDIEGFEPQALAGLDFDGPFRPRNVLLECEPEFLPRGWGTGESLAAFFSARGYTLHDVLGRPVTNAGSLPEANVWARDASRPEMSP
jgi:FkbM family methyltransferase